MCHLPYFFPGSWFPLVDSALKNQEKYIKLLWHLCNHIFKIHLQYSGAQAKNSLFQSLSKTGILMAECVFACFCLLDGNLYMACLDFFFFCSITSAGHWSLEIVARKSTHFFLFSTSNPCHRSVFS